MDLTRVVPSICQTGNLLSDVLRGRFGLARGNTHSDACVQYALPDRGPEEAGFLFCMAHNFGRTKLTSASPPHESGKALLGGGKLPVGFHTGRRMIHFLPYGILYFFSCKHKNGHYFA